MKKILILNGSHSEVPLIMEAKKLGYYVITTGNNKELVGHQYSNQYIYGDYSDKDKMLEIAVQNSIDAICSCANDFGAISAAYVAEKLKLPGHDSYITTELLHEKDKFKLFAKENNIQTPVADIYDNLEEAVRAKDLYQYPMIIKPVDLTGGKGVSKVNDSFEYILAIKEALKKSRKGRVVVEKFIKGTYHSFSTFLVDGKVIAYFSDNEYSYINPYFVATSGGPAKNVNKVKELLIHQVELIAEILQLVNGVFHMQYVMDENGVPYIIDITRRCSGDIYTEPVEHATGIPWAKWIVMSESGFSKSVFMERGEQVKFCGRHCIMADRNGKIKTIKISDELEKNIYKKFLWWKEGDIIEDYLTYKAGILFMEYESEGEMLERIANIKKLIDIQIE